ncbi:MAG: sigma-70 family RNA polymerase sigma factor [Actinomycetota bacterium]
MFGLPRNTPRSLDVFVSTSSGWGSYPPQTTYKGDFMQDLAGPSFRPRQAIGATIPLDESSFSSDAQALFRIAHGDADAFRSFLQRHAPSVLAMALRVARNSVIAEDATQETFLAVWRDAGRYQSDRGSVRAWLMTIAHHAAVDRVRREEVRRRVLDVPELAVVEDIADLAVAGLDGHGERARVRAALARLPENQRRIIELMYFAGRSQAQIAQLLKIPLGTVKSRCRAAMRELREELVTNRA